MAGAGICRVTRIYLSTGIPTLTLGLAAEAKARTNLEACMLLNVRYKNILRKDRWNREMGKQRNGDDTEIHGTLLF